MDSAPPEAPPPPQRSYRPSAAALTAILTAGFGFVCTLSFREEIVINGERSCSGFDVAPVVIGVVAIGAGLATLAIRRRHHQPMVEIPAGLAGIVLGVVHVLRGVFDIFGELC
jgi:hypothetical protein